ncbi:hypothetical protein PIB30_063002 [Stylosanthes scabra]|uniref:Uncharacterized protein n=1 Tax=Stylosanthes scabra TaxID=79078 RepID=A0ABU6UKV3_9FABA|nr:hypothetical protein [Stylosanthes scabra]
MANVYRKTHRTTFDMSHALLIYVLKTEGVVSLPCIMKDILLTRPMKHSRHLLPYPVFISRLASECRVLEYPGDEFYTASTTRSTGREAAATNSLHSALYLRSVFFGAFSARGYETLGLAGEIAASSESPDREHSAYDTLGIPIDRFHRLGAYLL